MEAVEYILRFLLAGKETPGRLPVGYTADRSAFGRYKVVIIPSPFFHQEVYGTENSLPRLPLALVEGVPLLFGQPLVERQGNTLVVHADVVASAYFLLSRYEEMVRRNIRDRHGRFPGSESLPARCGFIHRPIVDEYGRLLRGWLRQMGENIPEPTPGIRRVYLTHDVDYLARYLRLKGVAAAITSGPEQALTALKVMCCGKVSDDPWFTFPRLLECDKRLPAHRREIVFFIKPGGGRNREDLPHARVNGRSYATLFSLLRQSGAKVGLHASYRAGKHPHLVAKEKAQLEKAWGERVDYNRHHYLSSREPEHMRALTEAGLHHDFTLGYAHMAGFRLGTCRPVHRIDPATRQLTGLILHPLTAMDVTLDSREYMHLNRKEALHYVQTLLHQVAQHAGEACLLWHNTSMTQEYHRCLYPQLIDSLKDLLAR